MDYRFSKVHCPVLLHARPWLSTLALVRTARSSLYCAPSRLREVNTGGWSACSELNVRLWCAKTQPVLRLGVLSFYWVDSWLWVSLFRQLSVVSERVVVWDVPVTFLYVVRTFHSASYSPDTGYRKMSHWLSADGPAGGQRLHILPFLLHGVFTPDALPVTTTWQRLVWGILVKGLKVGLCFPHVHSTQKWAKQREHLFVWTVTNCPLLLLWKVCSMWTTQWRVCLQKWPHRAMQTSLMGQA